MRRVLRPALFIGLVLVGIAWLGFQVPAPPPELRTATSRFPGTAVVYVGLPPGLQSYLAQTVSRTPPVTTTAHLWGTGRLLAQIGPLSFWFPLRWEEFIDVTRGFIWRAEVAWWRVGILTIEDRWDDGEGVTRIGWRQKSGPCVSQSQAMRGLAELVWLPSALVTRPDITWTARGDRTAIMGYAGPAGPDSLVVRFDRRTGALTAIAGAGTRCRASGASPASWVLRLIGWDAPGGLIVPVDGEVAWDDKPYYRFHVVGITYNEPLDDRFGPTPTSP